MKVEHIYSSEETRMQPGEVSYDAKYADGIQLTGEQRQRVEGFGACFNELGWEALQHAESADKDAFIQDLFSPEGCGFNAGRVSIGANDFSLAWYSCDEVSGDYALEHFTIDRDKAYSIPFIKQAAQHCPNLFLFASPWSPPTWMKTHQAYNYGRIRMEHKVLDAYARYFVRFVQEYQKLGLTVSQVHVQNEPMADQKFPSCLWHGEDMREFIANYLGPAFEKAGLSTEIWLGTINGPFVDFRWPGYGAPYGDFYDRFANTILSDEKARAYIAGVGVQWGGKHQLEQIEASYPELRVMQTESECGDGANAWEQAEYIFMQMWFYFRHHAERYFYWNMALPEGGESTWGWRQNSLCTVNRETKEIKLQPEYYLMRHFSKYVKPGAVVLATKGRWTSNTVAFQNPNGEVVLLVGNTMNSERGFTFRNGDNAFSTMVAPHTIHTFVIS